MDNELLCTLKMPSLTFACCSYPEFHIKNAQGNEIAIIERQFEYSDDMLDRFKVFRPFDYKLIYTIEGKFRVNQFLIRNEFEEIVGRIGRKLVEKAGFWDSNYGLEVSAGVDILLMVCVCSEIGKYQQRERHNKIFL